MDPQAKSSPGTDIWHDQFNRYFIDWIYSGFRDHSALATASNSLKYMFRRAPERAAEIQELAIVLYSLGQQFVPLSFLSPLATLGLEAGTVLTGRTADQVLRRALLLLWLADGYLAEEQQFDSLETLRLLERTLQRLPEDDPVTRYLAARREHLHGRIWELGLESSRALAHYWTAMDGGGRLLMERDELEQFAEQWMELIFGTFSTMIEPLRPHLAASAVQDLRSLTVSAMLGQLRNLADDTTEARLADMIAAVQRRVEAWGLPKDFGPLELVQIVVGFRGRLSAQRAQTFVETITAGNRLGQLPDTEADWKAPVYAMLARLYAEEGDAATAQRLRDIALRSVEDCSSATFRALTLGYLLSEQRSLSGDLTEQEVEPFLKVLSDISEAAGQTPIQLRLKLLLEEPLEGAIEWAVRAWIDTPDLSRRVRLGVLLDILRQPLWSPVPSETWFTEGEAGESSMLAGLRAALDRLQRIHYALRQRPDTVVLIIQQLGDRTLFLCVTGEVGNSSIQVSFAGASYREASRGLAQAAMDELDFVAGSGGGLQGDGLTRPGRRAYEALPPKVQSAIGTAETLLLVPDFRADEDSVPFELMHDGTTFLGVFKVIARLASLSHAVRVLEPGATPSAHTRAIVAAAPEPRRASFPALDFVRDEAQNVRDFLAQEGWDAPVVTEERLSSTFVTERLEYVDVWHIAAHGEVAGGEEALLLPDGRRMVTDDLLPRHFPRLPFVYLNTCFLAETRYVGGGVSRGLVYTLAERGAPAVIANLSPVMDDSASRVSWEFYGHVLQGTVGEALRDTRARLLEMGVSPALWGTTVLFGNPEHRLAGSVSAATNRSPDLTENLLMSSLTLRPDPDRGAVAWVRAIKSTAHDSEDARLLAAGYLVLSAHNLYANPATVEVVEREFEQAIVLADELNHLTARVITRILLVNRLISLGDWQRVSLALEDLLPLLDAQARRDADWQPIRVSWLAVWQRLQASNNEGYPDIPALTEAHNSEAERAEAELVKLVIEGSAAGEAREDGGAELRYDEDTLDDIAWNAIVIGHQSRFEDMLERANYARELARKLREQSILSGESEPYAATLLSGLLSVVWAMQSDVYLPQPLAAACSDGLVEAIRDINSTWSPPTSEPWFHIVRAFPEAVDSAMDRMLNRDFSAQNLAAHTYQERDALTTLGKRLLDRVVEHYPDHVDGCTAYLIGTIIQKNTFFWLDPLEEAAAKCLDGVFVDIAYANEDKYLPRYLGKRLDTLKHPEWDELDRWKHGLSLEDYVEHRSEESNDLSTFFNPKDSLVFGPDGNLYMSVDTGKRLARAYLASFGRPIAEHPPEAVGHAERGVMALAVGNREKALEWFDEAIHACPEYGEAFACRAVVHRELGHQREAEQDIKDAVERGIDPNVLKPSSADEIAQHPRQEGAATTVENVPHGPLAQTFDFSVLNEPFEQTADAVDDPLTQFLDGLENDYEPEDASDYAHRGALFSALGLQERAIEDFDKAIRLDPQAAKSYVGRAIAYMTLGREVEAEADVEHAIALGMDGGQVRSTIEELKRETQRQDPSDAAKVYVNSAAYHQRREHWDKALSAFEEALKLDPQSAVAFAGRAASLLVLGRPQEALNDFDEALRLNPGDAQAHAGRAAAYAYLEEPDKTEQDLARAIELGMDASLARAAIDSIKLEPEDKTSHAAARAHWQAAAEFMDQQRLHEAINEYSEALKLDSSYLAAYAGRASAHLLSGHAAEALLDFNEALRLNPESSEAWCFKGWALDALERYEEAVEAYGEALRLNPEYSDAWYYRGRALAVGLGRLQEGLESLEEALRLKPEAPEAWELKGAVLEELGHHEEALEAYDRALHQRPGFRTWLAKGGVLAGSGRYEGALEAYEGALRLEPRSPEAWYYKGAALHDLGRYEEALEAYDEALRLNPESPELWCYKGEILIELERSEEALEVLEQALRLNAEYPEAWVLRGVALGELRRFQEALEALDNALSLSSENLSALDSKLWVLTELGRHQEALEEVEKALRFSPEDPTFWDTKSLIYSNLGRYQEALIASDTALSYEPELPSAFQHKGVALAKLGRHEEAVSWLCQAWGVRERLADEGSVVAETLEELGYDLDECER
jgi:tetratricopeptide (TPR) repeat protein